MFSHSYELTLQETQVMEVEAFSAGMNEKLISAEGISRTCHLRAAEMLR